MKCSKLLGLLVALWVVNMSLVCQAASPPNIVYILCDDLGYGDVQCLNPERGKIATPHMDLLDVNLPDTAGEDSVSFLPALQSQPIVSTRAGVIHHSISGHFAYRSGKWKLCLAKGSGGWSKPTEKQVPARSPVAQLYDLEKDPGETANLYQSHPEVVQQLLKQLESDVQRGRSTAGAQARNDIEKIRLWKSGK